MIFICVIQLHSSLLLFFLFFFNDTATTEIYTLSLHDALPISQIRSTDRKGLLPRRTHPSIVCNEAHKTTEGTVPLCPRGRPGDRKSTRLNSSHTVISYAVFCLKKKKNQKR